MSETTAAPFDPAAYKATTREQWQQAAEPWHRWGPTLEAWLGEATETMLDLAGVAAGARVLDVGAGDAFLANELLARVPDARAGGSCSARDR